MFRTIETSTWDDPRVRPLSPLAKLLFLYLITNRHTHVSGIYVLPVIYAEHETGVPAKALEKSFDELVKCGLVQRDIARQIVWVCKMFAYQGRGAKNYTAAAKHLVSLHRSELVPLFVTRYPEVFGELPSGYLIYTPEIGYRYPIYPDTAPVSGPESSGADHGGEPSEPPAPEWVGGLDVPFASIVPGSLQTPAFAVAWTEWVTWRRTQKRKAVSELAAAYALKKLAKVGPANACAALERGIANDWTGVFPDEKASPPPSSGRPAHMQVIRAPEGWEFGK